MISWLQDSLHIHSLYIPHVYFRKRSLFVFWRWQKIQVRLLWSRHSRKRKANEQPINNPSTPRMERLVLNIHASIMNILRAINRQRLEWCTLAGATEVTAKPANPAEKTDWWWDWDWDTHTHCRDVSSSANLSNLCDLETSAHGGQSTDFWRAVTSRSSLFHTSKLSKPGGTWVCRVKYQMSSVPITEDWNQIGLNHNGLNSIYILPNVNFHRGQITNESQSSTATQAKQDQQQPN